MDLDAPGILPDEVLVQRILRNEEALAAFSVFYLRHKPKVYCTACRIVKNPEDAEEIAQETLWTASQQLSSLQKPEHFRSWLLTIAKHKSLDRLRQRRQLTTGLDACCEKEDEAPSPHDQVSAREWIAGTFQQFKEEVKPKIYRAMVLHVRGYAVAEIAHQLGLKESAVRTYLSTARQAFRNLLCNRDERRERYMSEHNRRADPFQCPKWRDRLKTACVDQLSYQVAISPDVCYTKKIFVTYKGNR
jgi:RNA polymerase sigma-70 factor (ECF subfamily)